MLNNKMSKKDKTDKCYDIIKIGLKKMIEEFLGSFIDFSFSLLSLRLARLSLLGVGTIVLPIERERHRFMITSPRPFERAPRRFMNLSSVSELQPRR